MPIESGTLSLRRYCLQGSCRASSNEMWLNGLKKHAFAEKKLKLEDENSGWVVFDDELSTNFAIDNCAIGKFIVFSMRLDRLKIPRSLLQMHVKHRIRERLKDGESKTLSRNQQSEIRNDVIEELSKTSPADIQVVQVMIDTARKELYINTTQSALGEMVAHSVEKSFELKCREANFMSQAQKIMTRDDFERVLDEPGVHLRPQIDLDGEPQDGPESRLGSAFLTWLLHMLQDADGNIKNEQHGELGMMVDDYLLLEGEVSGSRQITLKKGLLASCAELATSLKVGKLVAKARFKVAREGKEDEGEQWNFVVDKKNYDLSSLKTPRSKDPDAHTRTLHRLLYLVEAFEIMDGLFQDYLELRYGKAWKKAGAKISQWIETLQPAV